ncbi:MAG TPA: DUF2156 domain-containing protein [Tepidisphaeraceae bacterium]|jgi:hypothetical protein|nr:DUF2156 domain-containing protein [Tepidisphaeraceae bacterium]
MGDDPLTGWGLRSVELSDRAVFHSYFASLEQPLSDYTFSQLYTWRNSLRILWKMIRGHLCVFANGTGDLTLLMPPIGDTSGDAALAESFELMNEYNARRGVLERSRVEYVSEELLARFDASKLSVAPMRADYVYDVRRMIDLAGSDLASKRQAKNRFMRNYGYRVEPYRVEEHGPECLALLDKWKLHQDGQHLAEIDASAVKRSKETTATALCLETADQLGLKGLVVYARGAATPPTEEKIAPDPVFLLRGFTFGEVLGNDQSSITIEKTDLEIKGLAQFIFSEFCRLNWADRPLVNVGDDWGVQTLAWTKQSYRPVKLLPKFMLKQCRPVGVGAGPAGDVGSTRARRVRGAKKTTPAALLG